jgi:hypothetical protein
MEWFGPAPFAKICNDIPQGEQPVDEYCAWCSEAIRPGESGFWISAGLGPKAWHEECQLRSIVGGLNHLEGNCTCCGGTLPPDPIGVSIRDAAILAVLKWNRMNHPKVKVEEDE